MNGISIGIHELVEVILYVREGGDEGPAVRMRNGDDHGISIGNHRAFFLSRLSVLSFRIRFSPFLSHMGHIEMKGPFMMGACRCPEP
jgi:hypothetical protein